MRRLDEKAFVLAIVAGIALAIGMAIGYGIVSVTKKDLGGGS